MFNLVIFMCLICLFLIIIVAFQNHSVPDNLCDIGVTRKSPWKTDIK